MGLGTAILSAKGHAAFLGLPLPLFGGGGDGDSEIASTGVFLGLPFPFGIPDPFVAALARLPLCSCGGGVCEVSLCFLLTGSEERPLVVSGVGS